MPNKENSTKENDQSTGILKIYDKAVKNVPLLKYGWIIIATICILAFAASFKLNIKEVILYSVIVLGICLLGYIFSYLLKTRDKFIKYLLYFLISCIILTIGFGIISFATYIFFGKPTIYNKFFNTNQVNMVSSNVDSVKNNKEKNDSLNSSKQNNKPANDTFHQNSLLGEDINFHGLIPIPGVRNLFDDDLIIRTSHCCKNSPHRVDIVISSISDTGLDSAWTESRLGDGLAQTSNKEFVYKNRKYLFYINTLPTNPEGSVEVTVKSK